MPIRLPKPNINVRNPALSFGLNFAGGMALFVFLGYKLDARTGGGIGWTVAGAFMGLAYGGYELWKVIRWLNEEEARKKKLSTGEGEGKS